MKNYFIEDESYSPIKEALFPCMIIIQARMGSTRLPGKVMKPVIGKPLLSYLVDRLRCVRNSDGIVIATTQNEQDDEIAYFCDHSSLHCVRGDEEDVLSRYYTAASLFQLEVCVRITSDCPLIDPSLVELGISTFNKHFNELDYLSNTQVRTFARGMDFEIFRMSALKEAFFKAQSLPQKEHVTPYIVQHPRKFRLGNISQKKNEEQFRLTVDTPEDFELIKVIIEQFFPHNPNVSNDEIVSFLRKNPDLTKLNEHIKQKGYHE